MTEDNFGIRIVNDVLKGKETEYRIDYTHLGKLILDKLEKNQDSVGQVDPVTDEKYTFRQMRERSVRCALWMRAQGLLPGDVVVICSHNQLDAPIPCFAALYLGAIFNPWDAGLNSREFRHLMNVCKPKMAFVSEGSCTAIADAAKDAKLDVKIVVLGQVSGFLEFSDVIAQPILDEVENFRIAEIETPNETAIIACSSGTTGLPKGVALSHETMIRILSYFEKWKLNVTMFFTSLHWLTGTFCMLLNVFAATTNVLAPTFEEYSACAHIEKYKVNWVLIPPSMINRLLKSNALSTHDFSLVRLVSSGGASLADSSREAFAKFVPNAFIDTFYGGTETGGSVTFFTPNRKPGSCGRIRDNVQLKVIDPDTGRILGANQEGEFYAKTPTMMKFYHNNSQATAEVFDDDGWLRTGDLGYYDEEGNIFVVDRLKELIKYGNYQISPNEIEGVISSHPGVKEAVVVGLPHPIDGEHPIAFVVKSTDQSDIGEQVTEMELINLVATKLSDTKRLRGGVRFVDSLPKSPSAKILRRVARDWAKTAV